GYRVQSVVPRWWATAVRQTGPSWSREARERHRIVQFSYRHGVALAAEACGKAERTVIRWRKQFRDDGMKGLEDRPTTPRKQRQQFSAIDVVSRITWTTVRTRATATTARDFVVELVEAMPFRIRAIQVDGGAEFMSEFERACRD